MPYHTKTTRPITTSTINHTNPRLPLEWWRSGEGGFWSHAYINKRGGCCRTVNLGNPATAQEKGGGQHRKREQKGKRKRYAIAMQAAVHSVWPWGLH